MDPTQTTGTSPLGDAEHQALSALVTELGEGSVLRRLGLSRMALYRALARLPVTHGTRELIRSAIANGAGA